MTPEAELEPYRILVTGSRDWTNEAVISHALMEELKVAAQCWETDQPSHIVLVHGAGRGRGMAPGADALADKIAARWEIERESHPAQWQHYGNYAGPRRNKIMTKLGARVCLAFPLGESRGTYGCMELATKAGIPVIAYAPDCRQIRNDRSVYTVAD